MKKFFIIGIVVITLRSIELNAFSLKKFFVQLSHRTANAPEKEKAKTRVGYASLKGPLTSATELVDKLYQFLRDDTITAVILHVDSPGGAAGSAELIRQVVKELAEAKYIVTVVENQCCSAAYWAICSANSIIVSPASDVGSIGAYTEVERHEKPKIKTDRYQADTHIEIFKAGKYKALWNAHNHQLSQLDREYVQKHVDDCYHIFCATVQRERNLNDEELARCVEGRVFTGLQAIELKLADAEGGLLKALNLIFKKINGTRSLQIKYDDVEFVK